MDIETRYHILLISLWYRIKPYRLSETETVINIAKGRGFVADFRRGNVTLFFGILVIFTYVPA